MDYRSVEWIYLLPPETGFVVKGAPNTLHELVQSRSSGRPDSLIGWELSSSDLPDLDRYRSVVLVRPRGIGVASLRDAGFEYTCAFTALPPLADTRWLLPLGDTRLSLSALDLAAPWRYRDRLKRTVLSLIVRAGQLRHTGDTIILGRRSKSELEQKFESALHVRDVRLALRTGPPRVMRKTTIQLMDAAGGVKGFAKLATSPDAQKVVSREVACLQDLSHYPSLERSVPRLLDAFHFSGGFVSVQTPGPSRRGPTVFGEAHQAFLSAMASSTRRTMPFRESAMARDMSSKMSALAPQLPMEWHTRLTTSLDNVFRTLGSVELPLATAHRDFGPWNTRLQSEGRLFVFDWDVARQEMLPLYDLIGFHFLNYANLAKQWRVTRALEQVFSACRRWAPEIDQNLVPLLFLAYLTEVALGRLIGALWRSDLQSDPILQAISHLLDTQYDWMPVNGNERK